MKVDWFAMTRTMVISRVLLAEQFPKSEERHHGLQAPGTILRNRFRVVHDHRVQGSGRDG
ncbi:hypothetical protein PG988_012740 [Apiospora saccharicola]